jgi:L-idonate 5-dehydrogenase
MRAVRIHSKQDMRIEQVPSPEPDAGEVRLRVGYVGICGSDLHYYADGARASSPSVNRLIRP